MSARPTVLIVDDYQDAVDVWELYLRASGFEVLTAPDGPTAITVAMTRLPDLVVLDLELPGRSGIEVSAVLRAQESTRHIPLIAATGYSHIKQLDLARKSGFDAIVLKPCEPGVLVAEIRRLLAFTTEQQAALDGQEST